MTAGISPRSPRAAFNRTQCGNQIHWPELLGQALTAKKRFCSRNLKLRVVISMSKTFNAPSIYLHLSSVRTSLFSFTVTPASTLTAPPRLTWDRGLSQTGFIWGKIIIIFCGRPTRDTVVSEIGHSSCSCDNNQPRALHHPVVNLALANLFGGLGSVAVGICSIVETDVYWSKYFLGHCCSN